MKNNKPQVQDKNFKPTPRRNRPEIRDNLDHREGTEQEFKGDDVTHNTKEHHKDPKKKK